VGKNKHLEENEQKKKLMKCRKHKEERSKKGKKER
jgi:hypothetical protein